LDELFGKLSNLKVALLVIFVSIQKFSPLFVILSLCVKSVKSRPCPAHPPAESCNSLLAPLLSTSSSSCSAVAGTAAARATHYFPLILQQGAEAAFLKFSSAFFAAS
jgi:hypothetical protein